MLPSSAHIQPIFADSEVLLGVVSYASSLPLTPWARFRLVAKGPKGQAPGECVAQLIFVSFPKISTLPDDHFQYSVCELSPHTT